MNTVMTESDWQAGITTRFAIQPTIEAMQRHLLFTLRSASVRSSEVAPGRYQTEVELEGQSWIGTGSSADEAMGRVLLLMTCADGTVVETPIDEAGAVG